jgi:hypothetical protein
LKAENLSNPVWSSAPKHPAMESWLRYVVHHPWRIILPIVLLTLFLAWQIPRLRFETSIYDLTIEDLPQTRQYNAFKKIFGCEEIILVVARTRAFLIPKHLTDIDRSGREFEKIKGVRRVISLPGIKRAMDITEKMDPFRFQAGNCPGNPAGEKYCFKRRQTTVISLILEDTKRKDPVIAGYRISLIRKKPVSPCIRSACPLFPWP